MRSPAMVFAAYSADALVSILIGIPCTRWFGLRGALFAWVLSGGASFVGAIVMIGARPANPTGRWKLPRARSFFRKSPP